eukprot:m.352841 g.352841  ORF g.352841 m.352841 type:complete len:409 (+) comp16621_c0_seq1:177-1403(+)
MDERLAFVLGRGIGCRATVLTIHGLKYTGVFTGFGNAEGDVALAYAYLLDESGQKQDTCLNPLTFKGTEIADLHLVDVDTREDQHPSSERSMASGGFTDAAISGASTAQRRTLQRFEFDDSGGLDDLAASGDTFSAAEMWRRHESRAGPSAYNEEDYTTKVDLSNPEAVARADRLAAEIERGSKQRFRPGIDDDDAAKYSTVLDKAPEDAPASKPDQAAFASLLRGAMTEKKAQEQVSTPAQPSDKPSQQSTKAEASAQASLDKKAEIEKFKTFSSNIIVSSASSSADAASSPSTATLEDAENDKDKGKKTGFQFRADAEEFIPGQLQTPQTPQTMQPQQPQLPQHMQPMHPMPQQAYYPHMPYQQPMYAPMPMNAYYPTRPPTQFAPQGPRQPYPPQFMHRGPRGPF